MLLILKNKKPETQNPFLVLHFSFFLRRSHFFVFGAAISQCESCRLHRTRCKNSYKEIKQRKATAGGVKMGDANAICNNVTIKFYFYVVFYKISGSK